MSLKSGRFDLVMNPGIGADRKMTVALGQPVQKLYAVLNGFEMRYGNHDNHIKRMVVDLSVVHTPGASTAEVHCVFKFNDDDPTDGDTVFTRCDYLLIGE